LEAAPRKIELIFLFRMEPRDLALKMHFTFAAARYVSLHAPYFQNEANANLVVPFCNWSHRTGRVVWCFAVGFTD